MLIRVILLLLLLAALVGGCNGGRAAELLMQLDGYVKAKQSEEKKEKAEPEPSKPTPEAAGTATEPEATDEEMSEHDQGTEPGSSPGAPDTRADLRKKPTPDPRRSFPVAEGIPTRTPQEARRSGAFTILMLLIVLLAAGLVAGIWRTAFGVVKNRRTRLHQAIRSLLGEPNLVNKVGSAALAATVLIVGIAAWIVTRVD